MNTLLKISLAAGLLVIGCGNSGPNPQNVGGASVTESQVTHDPPSSDQPHHAGTDPYTDPPSHVEPVVDTAPPVNQSTSNLALYQVNDWAIGASQLWEPQKPPLPQVKLFLINKEESLIFSVLTEEIHSTPTEYVDSQVQFLKKLNLPNTTVKKTTINNVNYSLIESPASNFNNWQWILVEDRTAYVWSCGGPKNSKVNFESCLTVMTTVQK
jgi:hypothetical protein